MIAILVDIFCLWVCMDVNNTNKPYIAKLYVIKHAFEHASLTPYIYNMGTTEIRTQLGQKLWKMDDLWVCAHQIFIAHP